MLTIQAEDLSQWEPPHSFDEFELIELIGEGGMGRVYLARDRALDRPVAIKLMARSAVPGARSRFFAEARALARLTHPNVVGVYRIDEVDGHPYIAYEYVSGRSLDRVAKPMRWSTALAIACAAAHGLAAAHRVGILHRDVKPANVVVSAEGDVKVIDFGLARVGAEPAVPIEMRRRPEPVGDFVRSRLSAMGVPRSHVAPNVRTLAGAAVGTPRYWAPEQWMGERVDARTDVYALGLVLYELLVGEPPFPDLVGDELRHAIVDRGIPPIEARGAPAALSAIVDRCLDRDPTKRFATAGELAAALDRVQSVFVANTPSNELAQLSGQAALVAESWAQILLHKEEFGARLYERLFAEHPELRRLFPEDLGTQRRMIVHALDLAVRGLSAPEAIAPMLHELGARHLSYHVGREHLTLLTDAVVEVLPSFDSRWREETRRAWERAMAFVVGGMVAGMNPTPTPHPSSAPERSPIPRAGVEMPETAYAAVGDAAVAYHVFGSGPPTLVFAPGLLSHVELTWAHAGPASLLRGLGAFARVVLLDFRGAGLSERIVDPTLDDGIEDLAATLDAVGADRAVLVGAGFAGPTCLAYAATHPERTAGLVLFGTSARFSRAPDFDGGHDPSFFEALEKIAAAHWGTPTHAQIEVPSLRSDTSFCEWLAMYERMSASRRRALESLRFVQTLDVRPLLERVRCPALAVHRRGDRTVPLEAARFTAERLLHGRLVELDGDEHTPFAGDVDTFVREINRFAVSLSETVIDSSRMGS